MTTFPEYTTASLTNASTAVTITGGALTVDGVRAGDLMLVAEAGGPVAYPVESVASATALTLTVAYAGATGTGKSVIFARRYGSEDGAAAIARMREIIEQLNSGAYVAGTTHDATAKASPVDADEFGLTDSAASFSLKKMTFANLWAWVKSKLAGTETVTIGGLLVQTNSVLVSGSLDGTTIPLRPRIFKPARSGTRAGHPRP
ncbi:MAG: hypothetical protein R3D34_06910 [Nitratireductor sp.]